MELSKEVLDQINEKRKELEAKQETLARLLEETKAEMVYVSADASACKHLLDRSGYDYSREETQERPSDNADIIGN